MEWSPLLFSLWHWGERGGGKIFPLSGTDLLGSLPATANILSQTIQTFCSPAPQEEDQELGLLVVQCPPNSVYLHPLPHPL